VVRHNRQVQPSISPPADSPEAAVAADLTLVVAFQRENGSRPGLYVSVEEVVLAHGRWFAPAPLASGLARGPARQCYANAKRLSRSGLFYVEGFASLGLGLVLPHAWCVDSSGMVQDPTWPDGDGAAYLGIPLTSDYVAAVGAQPIEHSILHDGHRNDFAVLRKGLPSGAIADVGAAHAPHGVADGIDGSSSDGREFTKEVDMLEPARSRQ
jgi:hypothetical protein